MAAFVIMLIKMLLLPKLLNTRIFNCEMFHFGQDGGSVWQWQVTVFKVYLLFAFSVLYKAVHVNV